MKNWFLLLLIVIPAAVFSQDSAVIVLHKDPRIDLLVNKQIEINEITTRSARRTAQGFRILVMNTNDRQKALDAKTTLYQRYPDLKSYLMYQSPFFKLKIGNFKDRTEAEPYLEDIKQLFQSGVYVVRDVIEVNPLEN